MASYFNYEIEEFIIESLDGKKSIDATSCVARIKYFEDIFDPAIFISMQVVNTDGLISSLPIRGGERVRLIISQEATGQRIEFTEEKNQYYIYKVYGSTSQSTREAFFVDLAPVDMYKNETSRVIRRYPENQGAEQKISDSVEQILKSVLKTDRNIFVEPTQNSYAFYGNTKKPFNVISWLCPKSIPPIGKSSPEAGTAGYLFYQSKNGYNFRSVDSLMSPLQPSSGDSKNYIRYFYNENTNEYADNATNFKVLTVPTFNKNVNIQDNLLSGMYSSSNYFFDLNTKKFNYYKYKLSDSYEIMNHASSDKKSPKIPQGLEESPSRVMVRFIDGIVKSPGTVNPNEKIDDRIRYQAHSVTRYNLAFSQIANITVPLNLNLTVGDVIFLDIGEITKQEKQKDSKKSGLYLIAELAHEFSDNQGYTGLKLVRDSYGEP
jgi:hypothetical protein